MKRLFLFLFAAFIAPASAAVTLEHLRTEYLINPPGIDVERPRLSWVIAAAERGQKQTAYRILVSSSEGALAREKGDLWDSGKVVSSQNVFIPYSGRALTSGLRCWWQVRIWDRQGRASAWSKPANWSMGLLQKADWQASWIGARGAASGPLPFPWLRKTVELKTRAERATAYVNALGYYELYINGKKVDDHVLAPAVSDFSKRNYYVTHDVTSYLVPGKNCVALWLGRGWYVKGHPGVIHDGPLVRLQLDATLQGGARQQFITDASWKTRESPTRPLGRGTAFGDYGGERYDASLEVPDWNAAGLDDSGWQAAAVFDPPEATTSAQMVQPNRIIETLNSAKVEPAGPGSFLIDMGRNYTGWLELRLPADTAAGKMIRIEYADNRPAGERFASYNQRDEYLTRSGGGQAFRSRFNYHAFRFARVTGLDRAPAPEDLKGYLIRTSYAPAGEFECSHELLNRIYRTVNWTYQMLTLGGYVVDCPHRERLGYGGDAGTSMETGMFSFDTGGLYNKWTGNWRDAQHPETGDLPYTAPNYPDQGGGGPMWSGFIITLPWQLYVQYGDRPILETSYPAMERFLGFLETKVTAGLLEPYVSYGIRMPQWNYLGDWLSPKRPPEGGGPRDPVSSRFINNCYYLYNLQLASKIAGLLGKPAEAARWKQRGEALQAVLHQRFYRPAENSYATGEQPYLAFPLFTGMVPENEREAVEKRLEHTIRVKNGGHLDGGMHGLYFLLRELMREDRNDLIFEMASKTTYPSWGYMLQQDATTIWESWSGGSRIHDTLISIGAWFTEGLAGIRADEKAPGFEHFFIQPSPVGGLTHARASYDSIRGRIESEWRLENGTLRLKVTVPVGSTATVLLPATGLNGITESGRPVSNTSEARFLGMERGRARIQISSGRYDFVALR